MKGDNDVVVRQRSRDRVEMVCHMTKGFQREELYGLSRHLCQDPVPTSKAEGQARNATAGNRNVLKMVRCRIHGLIAERLKSIDSEKFVKLPSLQMEINK